MPRLQPVRPWVWLEPGVRSLLEAEALRWAPRETGGILLGYSADSLRFVITEALGPGPSARHGRFWFRPDENYHDEEVARIYEHSGHKWTYLGDWHTHPRGGKNLSWLDRRTLRRISETPSARAPTPLMGIVHGRGPWELTIWVRQGRELIEAGIINR